MPGFDMLGNILKNLFLPVGQIVHGFGPVADTGILYSFQAWLKSFLQVFI